MAANRAATLPGRVPGAGQAVEGEAVEEGHEGLGGRLRAPGRPRAASTSGGQPLEGGQRLGHGGLERRVAARLQVHLVLGHEHRLGADDQHLGQPFGDVVGAGPGGAEGQRRHALQLGHPLGHVELERLLDSWCTDSK